MEKFDLFRDLAERWWRCLFGHCGNIRTGKSTFIKRFMELLVLPLMEDPHEKKGLVTSCPKAALAGPS